MQQVLKEVQDHRGGRQAPEKRLREEQSLIKCDFCRKYSQ